MSSIKAPYSALGDIAAVVTYSSEELPFLEIKGTDYKARFATFTNIIFISLVHFEDTDISVGLIFDNCTFNEPLVFKNIKASGHDPLLNPDSQNLVFKNCKFQSRVLFEGKKCSLERSLLFEGCIFTEGLEVEKLNISTEGLTLKNCTIEKLLDLFYVDVKQNLSLSGNKINCSVRIENLSASYLTLTEENIFSDNFHIRHSNLENGIVFNNGTFKKEIYFTHIRTNKSGLIIIGSLFEKAFFVNFHSSKLKPDRGFYTFFISSSKFNNGIYIDGKEDLFADDPIVEKIEIDFSPELKGNIVFRNLHVGILEMSGFNTSANVLFEHLFINQIKIKALINNSGLIFSGIQASHETWFSDEKFTIPRENAIYIDGSNFGKAQFYQVNFSSFKNILFHNNILTEISTSLVKWFTPDQFESSLEKHSLIAYKQARKSKDKLKIQNSTASLVNTYRSRQEIYRQLKFASQRQGDIPQSLDFRRHEMNYYRKIVAVRNPRKWEEFLILWTNQTNDFGQNWRKPVWMAAAFNLFFFIAVVISQSNKIGASLSFNIEDIIITFSELYNYGYLYWQMFNPTLLIHRAFKSINGKSPEINNAVFFWMILSKIFMAYFIYQTISAFRRFSK